MSRRSAVEIAAAARGENISYGITKYSYLPIQDLTTKYITIKGLQLVLSDENVGELVMQQLLQTEADFVKENSPELMYLLEDHDKKEVVETFFGDLHGIGFAHVACIIQDNLDSSYANIVAEYAIERDIPFVTAAIALNDYRQVRSTLFYYHEMDDGTLVPISWTAKTVGTKPPVSLKKMAKSGRESIRGLNDNYVVEIFRTLSGNRSATAEILGVTRQTVTNKLKRLGYFDESGHERKNFEEWYENEYQKKVLEDAQKKALSEPPKTKGKYNAVQYLTDEQVISLLEKYDYNKKAASVEAGISYPQFLARCHKIQEQRVQECLEENN